MHERDREIPMYLALELQQQAAAQKNLDRNMRLAPDPHDLPMPGGVSGRGMLPNLLTRLKFGSESPWWYWDV